MAFRLAIVNRGSNNVTVLLGVKGNGHFTGNGSYAVGGAPQSVTTGDYNGDGRVDLFVANGQENTITVLLGDGNGGFTQAKGSPFPAGAGPGSISSGDFNHDGKTDVAVVDSGSDNVSVLLGAGVVSSTTLSVLPAISILGAPVSLTAMVNPQATGGVTFYDGVTPLGGAWLDHGLAIFQTSMLSSGVHNLWAYYRGDTTYPPSRSVTVRQVVNTNTVAGFVRGSADGLNVYSSPHGVELADFNRDGQADLVVATDNDVRIYLGDGHGGFAFQSTPVIDDLAPEAIAVADFDGDGNQDIAIAIKYGRIGIFLGDGRGAFHVATGSPIQITNVASSLAVGDFNQDGIVDLVLGTNESGTVLLGKGRGEFLPPVALDVSPSQDYIGIADFDGDGKADLAVLNTGSVNVLFGNGSGQFTAPQSSLFGIPYATSVTVGDVNGDGAPDLAITSLNETLSVAFSRGTEDFNYTDPVMLASGSLPGASRIADVNGDGKPDLIVENHQTNDVSILLGDGQGGFTPVKTWALRVGSNPVSLAVGDLNGDGREDLIVANGVSTNISVLLGTVPTPLGFYPLAPCRVADTRDVGKAGGFGPPPLNAGATRDFPIAASDCGVPASAQAYALNATVVPHGPLGYLSLCSSGQPFPTVSTLNSPDGSVTANAAIVPAGSSGAITALVTNEADLVLDINGYFGPPTESELSFYPVTPCRVVDTRATNKGALFGSPTMAGGEQRDFPISQSACGIPSTAQAYALNFTVVPQGPLGYLSAWPTGKPFPVVSTLNSPKGSVVANAAIVPAGDNGAIRVLATAPSGLIIDVNGYFAPPSMNGIRFYALAPCRVVDTRFGFGSLLGPALAPGATRDFPIASSTCGVPPSAQAYSLNITAVPRGFLGYLSVWPAGSPFPIVSTLNSYQGLVVANAAIIPAGVNGAVSVLASDMTDLVIDINGYFAP